MTIKPFRENDIKGAAELAYPVWGEEHSGEGRAKEFGMLMSDISSAMAGMAPHTPSRWWTTRARWWPASLAVTSPRTTDTTAGFT